MHFPKSLVQQTKCPHGVANSDTPRLPTLKELLGYQTYDYTTTPSSVLFNLLSAIDINEDVDPLNRIGNEQKKEPERNVFYNTNENPLNDELDDILVKHDTDTNDISNEPSISKRRKTRIDHDSFSTTTIKPTTMRGTPISSLTAKSVTRGFYVTKGDIETTMAAYTTPDYLISTTEFSLENETTTLLLDMTDVTESIPKQVSTKSISTILQDTNKSYPKKFPSTTPLAPTTNLVYYETTKNDDVSSINDASFTKPIRKIRGRVRYTDGTTTPLYGHRIRSRIKSTTESSNNNVNVSSTLKNVVPTEDSTTTRYEELQSSTNLMTDVIVSSSKNVEKKTTSLDYTLHTESDTKIPETSTSMTTTFVIETIQPESSTIRSNIQTTQKTEDVTDANEIVSDNNDEYESTVIFNYATKHEITTTRHALTTPIVETTSEMTTPMKETESIETIHVETTTVSYDTAENTDILYDTTTAMPELPNTIISKSTPHIQQTTTFSETTQFPSTSTQNLPSSKNSTTSQEIREENIPRQRQRLNRFGQRTRANGSRRIVQRKEIEDRTLIQELSNSKPGGRHRVRVYRMRQRRPNRISSNTEANNFIPIDNTKSDIAEEQTRRLKLDDRRLKVNQNEYVEETIPTEQNSLRDTTPSTLVTEEYTERPVNEGTLSKGSGSTSGRTKPGTNILVNRLRNVNGSSQSNSVVTRPSTMLGDNRKSRPSGTSTVSPTATIVDAFEDATVSSPEQSIKDEDDRAEISDQNGRAQELAVTLADPPTSQSSSNTGRLPLRDTLRRRISTTVAPRTDSPRTSSTSSLRFSTVSKNRQRATSTTRKEGTTQSSTSRPSRPRRPTIVDYDYYEDEETPIVEKSMYNGKLFLTSKGTIKCLDQGNFPHPYSCKKFITCARIVNGLVIGAEYTCPDKLSFDPVGGICNWSAGLGCKE